MAIVTNSIDSKAHPIQFITNTKPSSNFYNAYVLANAMKLIDFEICFDQEPTDALNKPMTPGIYLGVNLKFPDGFVFDASGREKIADAKEILHQFIRSKCW
jgi:hypothetical protein